MSELSNVTVRTVLIKVTAGDKRCNNECPFFGIHGTGLIGEWHPRCELFHDSGKWREHTMKRAKECLKAEKAAAKKC